jgi:integrase
MAAAVASVSAATPGECLHPPNALARKSECRSGAGLHQLERGLDISTIQELLGHSDKKTTIIYTHELNRGVVGVKSPAGFLFS